MKDSIVLLVLLILGLTSLRSCASSKVIKQENNDSLLALVNTETPEKIQELLDKQNNGWNEGEFIEIASISKEEIILY